LAEKQEEEEEEEKQEENDVFNLLNCWVLRPRQVALQVPVNLSVVPVCFQAGGFLLPLKSTSKAIDSSRRACSRLPI